MSEALEIAPDAAVALVDVRLADGPTGPDVAARHCGLAAGTISREDYRMEAAAEDSMTSENPDSPSIAGCLRRIAVGDRANAIGSTLWWLRRAEQLLQTGGSPEQRRQVEVFRQRYPFPQSQITKAVSGSSSRCHSRSSGQGFSMSKS
jgi:hypothetical protein